MTGVTRDPPLPQLALTDKRHKMHIQETENWTGLTQQKLPKITNVWLTGVIALEKKQADIFIFLHSGFIQTRILTSDGSSVTSSSDEKIPVCVTLFCKLQVT